MQNSTPTSVISNVETSLNVGSSHQNTKKQLHKHPLTEPNFAAELELDTLVAELELNTNPV